MELGLGDSQVDDAVDVEWSWFLHFSIKHPQDHLNHLVCSQFVPPAEPHLLASHLILVQKVSFTDLFVYYEVGQRLVLYLHLIWSNQQTHCVQILSQFALSMSRYVEQQASHASCLQQVPAVREIHYQCVGSFFNLMNFQAFLDYSDRRQLAFNVLYFFVRDCDKQ